MDGKKIKAEKHSCYSEREHGRATERGVVDALRRRAMIGKLHR